MYNKVKHFTNPILRAEDTRRAFPIVTNTAETQRKLEIQQKHNGSQRHSRNTRGPHRYKRKEERATGTAEKQEPNQRQEKRQWALSIIWDTFVLVELKFNLT